MLDSEIARDARFVVIYFDRFYDLEQRGGVIAKLELLVRRDNGFAFWFADTYTFSPLDLEQFLRTVLLRKV
jgi:hypothetical protein